MTALTRMVGVIYVFISFNCYVIVLLVQSYDSMSLMTIIMCCFCKRCCDR